MRFQPGNKFGKGRRPSIKTQLKRFEERHPEAYDVLMEILYDKGREGSSVDAQYVIDRLKGKPKVTMGMDEEDRDTLRAGIVVEYLKQVRSAALLKEGDNAIQITRGQEEARQGRQTEEERGDI